MLQLGENCYNRCQSNKKDDENGPEISMRIGLKFQIGAGQFKVSTVDEMRREIASIA